MKHPEYSIIKNIEISDPGSQNDPVEFPAGTLVFVFGVSIICLLIKEKKCTNI